MHKPQANIPMPDGQWEPCEPDDEGAVRGVGVWRVE